MTEVMIFTLTTKEWLSAQRTKAHTQGSPDTEHIQCADCDYRVHIKASLFLSNVRHKVVRTQWHIPWLVLVAWEKSMAATSEKPLSSSHMQHQCSIQRSLDGDASRRSCCKPPRARGSCKVAIANITCRSANCYAAFWSSASSLCFSPPLLFISRHACFLVRDPRRCWCRLTGCPLTTSWPPSMSSFWSHGNSDGNTCSFFNHPD